MILDRVIDCVVDNWYMAPILINLSRFYEPHYSYINEWQAMIPSANEGQCSKLVWLNRLHKTVCVAGCRYLSDIVDKMHSGLVWSDLISTSKLCTLFIYKPSPAVLIWLQISDFQWEDATIFQTCWYSPQSRKFPPEDDGGLPDGRS